ncbi:hypothetical protein LPJ55_004506 [Coemansia sp. RSA 990]|nr:hypothetical protein LPJ55_004506 [Coemansia sp. RSA 990]
MGRKKINISEIENSRQKTVTFARRRAGLIKKAHELSILCGVKVAVVIFDSKNASHVYSSADTPEELFTRYLNKQFLTNESRKRKDTLDSSSDTSGGTYGFDNNGSFVRRRLAVVNEYKVTSDGPNSRNLHVKYTKQYHNPSAAASQRQSTGSLSTLSTHTLEQAMHSSPSVLSSQSDFVNGQMGGLPARTISLLKNMPAGSEHLPIPSNGLPYPPFHMGLNAEQPGVRNVDGLKNATRDLSALSLFSDNHGQINGSGIAGNAPVDIDGLFSPFMQRESNSPLSSSDGGSSYNNRCEIPQATVQNEEEHRAKRPRSQVYDADNGEDTKYNVNKSLVEDFLSHSGVAELLNTTWHPESKEPEGFESDSEESDEEVEVKEEPEVNKTLDPQPLPSLTTNTSIIHALQSLGMAVPVGDQALGASNLERDARLQQLFSGHEQVPFNSHSTPQQQQYSFSSGMLTGALNGRVF